MKSDIYITAHPSLPEFDYVTPTSLAEASQLLAEHAGEARPLLGGTDIFVRMRDGIWEDKYLVDVKALDGLDDIVFDLSAGLTIGAAVNMNQVSADPQVGEYYPVLVEAIESVASYQLRTRATIVGNICNASPAGDTIGACMLLDGTLNVFSPTGVRQEPLNTFFRGPGVTNLNPGDIVTSLQLPLPPQDMVGKYFKLGRNQASDLSIVGITVVGYPDADTVSGYRIRLALASVAPVPLEVEEVETLLRSAPITPQLLETASQAAMDTCTPIDDVRASARYRKLMVGNLSRKVLADVWSALRDQEETDLKPKNNKFENSSKCVDPT
jgi:carbon-monoxide dehydrogenase medium subunit